MRNSFYAIHDCILKIICSPYPVFFALSWMLMFYNSEQSRIPHCCVIMLHISLKPQNHFPFFSFEHLIKPFFMLILHQNPAIAFFALKPVFLYFFLAASANISIPFLYHFLSKFVKFRHI